MNSKEKTRELTKHREILLAAMDYFIQKHGECFLVDEKTHIKNHYENQKLLIEKYFQGRRLDKLQQKLRTVLRQGQLSLDGDFIGHIESHSNYKLDLLGEANEIKKRSPPKRMTEVVTITEKDGMTIEDVTFSNGPKRAIPKCTEIPSPDGRNKIIISTTTQGNPVTTISVQFANGASGGIYAAKPRESVKAEWLDSKTILIKSRTEFDLHTRPKTVRSFDEVIDIVFEEIDSVGLPG